MPINLNDKIRVKLTPYGLKKHKEAWQKKNISAFYCYYPSPIANTDGYSTFQLWDFMNTFGEYLYIGAESVIKNNHIEIIGE